jgi:hypothetical protein
MVSSACDPSRWAPMILSLLRVHSIQASGVLAWLDDFLYLPDVLYV